MSEVTSNRLKRLAHLEDGAGIVEMAEDEARCMRKICETTLQMFIPKRQVERVSFRTAQKESRISARYTFLLHHGLIT